MAVTRKAWKGKLMLSLYKKEGTYGTAPSVDASNYVLMHGQAFNTAPEFGDTVSSDKDEINGSEVATGIEIPEKRLTMGFSMDRALPDAMAGLGGAGLGSITSTQDGTATSYKHYIVPVAEGTEIPSFGAVIDPANRQEKLHGMKVSDLEISGEEGGYWKFSATMQGSGKREDSSETWQSAKTEKLLRMADTKVYIKTSPAPATDYIASANLDQDTDNISATQALTSLGSRVMGFSFKYTGNPVLQAGAGGGGYLQDVDFGRRAYEMTLKLRYADETERDYYENLTKMSLEFNCKNPDALIDSGTGTYYYGAILRVAQAQVTNRAYPTGDPYEVELTLDVQDDGTNEICNLVVFNGTSAYLAA